MKAAAIRRPGDLQVEDVTVPVPGNGKVRVAVQQTIGGDLGVWL